MPSFPLFFPLRFFFFFGMGSVSSLTSTTSPAGVRPAAGPGTAASASVASRLVGSADASLLAISGSGSSKAEGAGSRMGRVVVAMAMWGYLVGVFRWGVEWAKGLDAAAVFAEPELR